MNLRRIFNLFNIILTGLVVLVSVNIFLSWASQKEVKDQHLETDPAASTLSKSVKDVRSESKGGRAYRNLIRQDIFNRKKARTPVKVQQKKPMRSPVLNLWLMGTAKEGDHESYAVIQDGKTGRQEIYGVNDYIQGARIVEIQPERIVLNVNGREEVVTISYAPGKKQGRTISKPAKQPRPRIRKKKRAPVQKPADNPEERGPDDDLPFYDDQEPAEDENLGDTPPEDDNATSLDAEKAAKNNDET